MSGIKTLLGDGATGVDDFDLGEDFGRYVMGQELLPLLKDALFDLRTARIEQPDPAVKYTIARLESVIDTIESPREVNKGATAAEIAESINDIPF